MPGTPLPIAVGGPGVLYIGPRYCWATGNVKWHHQCTNEVDPDDDLGLCPEHIAMLRDES